MNRKLYFIACAIILLLVGCSSDKTAGFRNKDLNIIVTRNYGREILMEKTVSPSKNDTVMDVMQENFDVGTAYGGGFVNSIEGLASGYTAEGNGQKHGTKTDWFYYLDGVMAEVGAGQSMAIGPKTIAWDYHDWGGNMYVKTRIDAWPARFEDRRIEISGSEALLDMQSTLKGFAETNGGDAELFALDDIDIQLGGTDTVFIGTWKDATSKEFIRTAFEKREKSGLFAMFGEEGLSLFNQDNVLAGEYDDGAVIMSIQKSYGSDDMVLLIIGNEVGFIEEALSLFMGKDGLKGFFGLAVVKDGVHYAP